jgi:hypothetical protein
MAATSRTCAPVPFMRRAVVRGPMPASINTVPQGVRTIVQFPLDPLANTHISNDIPVTPNTYDVRTNGKIALNHQCQKPSGPPIVSIGGPPGNLGGD